jgi:hypothetical protein
VRVTCAVASSMARSLLVISTMICASSSCRGGECLRNFSREGMSRLAAERLTDPS